MWIEDTVMYRSSRDTTAESNASDTRCCFYLAVDLVGFLPPAVEQVPPFVLDVANMNVVAVVFPERNSSSTEDKQVVSMQDG